MEATQKIQDISPLFVAHLEDPKAIIEHNAYSQCRELMQTKKADSTQTVAFFIELAIELKLNDPNATGKTWHSILNVVSNEVKDLKKQIEYR